ncbi:hypothetical protein [Curtobacterium flaccumfaciens]|uniref:hypothetical protein n=1 Tax=Curtobacterium flaccumfaciens TaxID=2035 RepID=UPI001ADA8614|nr:hypothetical protein [Curtobacterium flaccumfaciens]MBO9049513.1 hypothetical protein [Curtobacterium flaccumfaciens pv. flaccumfaciens]
MPDDSAQPRAHARQKFGLSWPFSPADQPNLAGEPIHFVLTAIVAWNLQQDIRSLRLLWADARTHEYSQHQIREEVARRYELSTNQLDKLVHGKRYLQFRELQRFLDDATVGPQLREMLRDAQGVLYGRLVKSHSLEAAAARFRPVTMRRRGGKRVMSKQDLTAERQSQLHEIESAIETLMHVAASVQGDLQGLADASGPYNPAWGSKLNMDWERTHAQLRDHGLRRRIAAEAPESQLGVPFAAAVRAAIPHRREFTLNDLRKTLGVDLVHPSSSNILHSTIDSMLKRGELIRTGRGRYESTAMLGKRKPTRDSNPSEHDQTSGEDFAGPKG